MRSLLLLMLFASVAAAQDRFVERTFTPIIPYEHTAENAGIDRTPKHTQPSVTKSNALGYVNDTTFGMDYALFGRWPSRVFPGLWPEGRKSASFANQYATDGRFHVPDILAAQPFRRAVKEAKAEEKR